MNDSHNQRDTNLEPRVAKLEVGLERLTEDVRSLASVVRDQGATVEKQLTELTVAVTQAAGPRKTDWSLIISAVLLVMAIGSAAFWPLNQTVEENKSALENLNQSFQTHSQLPLHPVGHLMLQKLEFKLKENEESNKRDIENQTLNFKEIYSSMDKNYSKNLEYVQKIHDLELSSLKEKISLYNDKIDNRVIKLEDENRSEVERLKNELQIWRLKSIGEITSPSGFVNGHEEKNRTPIKNN